MKILVDLPDRQLDRLAEVCARDSKSRAEVIRAAIDMYLADWQPVSARDVFGIWPDAPDGLEYEDTLRAEWNRS